MKVELLKRLPVVLTSAVVLMGSTGVALADATNSPYLKTFGSDVMTGAWFANGNDCSTDTSSNYQNPNFKFSGASDPRSGGILTYSKTSGTSSGGDSSQYATFSVGEVDGRRPGDGFYSAGAQAAAGGAGSTSVKALTVANTDATLPFGGEAEGSTPQSSCIPDYYAKKPTAAGSTTNINNITQAIGLGSGNYSATVPSGSTFTLTNGGVTRTIPAGQRMTIYVAGDVYIDNNIVYDPASTVNNVPKFALIVKGSIYIDKGVTQLDGMYVAEPAGTNAATVAADDGVIWTCHPNNTAKLDYTYPPQCPNRLVVNGALIAKQISFLRVKGNIASANTTEDVLASAFSSSNISEIVNYTPAMVMGGDFFSSSSSSNTGGLPIDSLISLPPVF